MKRAWSDADLSEHWHLFPRERDLLVNKHGTTRLGFALLLKSFQLDGRFPASNKEIPKAVLPFVASQVEASPEDFDAYPWDGATIKRHRAEIREWCGFREITGSDLEQLRRWLLEDPGLQWLPEDQLEEALLQRCKALQIEPPAPSHAQRLLQSALHAHETRFCEQAFQALSRETVARLEALLVPTKGNPEDAEGPDWTPWQAIKSEPGKAGVASMKEAIARLRLVREVGLPEDLFKGIPPKALESYARRAAVEEPHELRRHGGPLKATLLAAYLQRRGETLTDHLVDLLIETFHKMAKRAEKKVEAELVGTAQLVRGKTQVIRRVARAVVDDAEGRIQDVILPVAGLRWWESVLEEAEWEGEGFRTNVRTTMHRAFKAHYRRILPELLETLEFRCGNPQTQPVMQALHVVKAHLGGKGPWNPKDVKAPMDGVVRPSWRPLVVETEGDPPLLNQAAYEVCTIRALREQLRCREIWVVGSRRYRNPEEDLPQDFEEKRAAYYEELGVPLDAKTYVASIKAELTQALKDLDEGMPANPGVRILPKRKGWIEVSPFDALPDPENLALIKEEIVRRWPMTSLLDVLKEADHRLRFTRFFRSPTPRERMDPNTLRRRLLLGLYGIGTNAGLTRITFGGTGESFRDLLYVRRRYVSMEAMRQAIIEVANATLAVRLPHVWGEATTTCASDSKQFGAWDQNLLTEWHMRYGGRGVMVYWHVEKKSVCIYSQFKRVSSSEAASMIEGVLRHCTEMDVDRHYVDSHGQSVVAFAFCRLLGFELMPRFKAIGTQKLYRAEAGQTYPNLALVMASRAIDWDLIEQQLDTMVKHAVAMKRGMADAESLLRRFTRANVQHPAYKALTELGKAIKTIFLCRYLASEDLRREVNEGLNVVESWNAANDLILFGRKGELATNRREDQEMGLLCLHLIQASLVYINTIMIQEVLEDPGLLGQMTPRDLAALSPLLTAHVTPFGRFDLDLETRLPLKATATP